MKLQIILFYTAEWNCYNFLGASLKIRKFTFKNYVIRIIFWFHMNVIQFSNDNVDDESE